MSRPAPKVLTVADLLALHHSAPQGTLPGICAATGRRIETGVALELTDRFTSRRFLHDYGAETVISPAVALCLNEPFFRRRSWFVSESKFEEVRRDGLRELLQNLPVQGGEAWALYTTQTGKKHGWLSLLFHVNFGIEQIAWGWDETPIQAPRVELLTDFENIERWLALGIKKGELTSDWKAATAAQNWEEYEIWRVRKQSLWWEWCVWCAPMMKREPTNEPTKIQSLRQSAHHRLSAQTR